MENNYHESKDQQINEEQKGYYTGLMQRYPEDIRLAYNTSYRNILSGIQKPRIIFLCGASFNYVPCLLVKAFLTKQPVIIHTINNYELPAYASKEDLAIILSYKGNQEEAVGMARTSRRIGCTTIVITSEKHTEIEAKIIKITPERHTRNAVSLNVFTIIKILEELNVITPKTKEVQEVLDFMRATTFNETAINIADKIFGKIPLIYVSPETKELSWVWKQYINRNAKTHVHIAEFPDISHNEIEGLKHKNGIYYAVLMYSNKDTARIKKKISLTKEQLKTREIDSVEINIKSEGFKNIMSGLLLGELVSYYLALKYKEDPLAQGIVETFRNQMGPYI